MPGSAAAAIIKARYPGGQDGSILRFDAVVVAGVLGAQLVLEYLIAAGASAGSTSD